MPSALVTQTFVEVLVRSPSQVRSTQTLVEVLVRERSLARDTQTFVEVLENITTTTTTSTTSTGPPPLRITQALVEVLGEGDPSVRITQGLVEVLSGGSPSTRISQVLVEVLVHETTTTTTSTTFTTTSTTSTVTTTTTVHGSICYGHDTAVEEVNIEDFTGKWEGTANISGSGDTERVGFLPNQYKQLVDPWYYGAGQAVILLNKYRSGSNVTICYKTAPTLAGIAAASWQNYTGKFTSQGFIDVRLTKGLVCTFVPESTTTTTTGTTSSTSTVTTSTVTTTTICLGFGSDTTSVDDMGYDIEVNSSYVTDDYGHRSRNDSTSDFWATSAGTTGYWQVGYPVARQITYLTITARNDTYYGQSPKDFTLEASNTGAWTGEEVVLLTVTGATWTQGQKNEWYVDNFDSYLYYRLDVTDVQSGANVSFTEIELLPCADEVIADWPPCGTYGSNLTLGENTSASSYYSGLPPEDAVDGNVNTWWASNTGDMPCWWQVEFLAGRKVNKLTITARNDGYYYQAPVDFTLSGSNTGSFGGEEVLLLTVTDCRNWTTGSSNTWLFLNDNYYKYYRIDISKNQGGTTNGTMAEVNMYGCSGDNPSTTTTT